MNLDLRQAVVQKMQNKTDAELIQVMNDSIGGDERVLPGLGVLFEIIWRNSEDATKLQLVETLNQHVTS
jgi:small acid-soluble spore protein I (minor)